MVINFSTPVIQNVFYFSSFTLLFFKTKKNEKEKKKIPSMTTFTSTYLTTNNGGRLPTKSVSTSTISLLPRPIASVSHHRKTNVPKKSTTTKDKNQRATTTPQVHRRRTSSSSSNSSLTSNWLTGIFPQSKKTIKSAIRLSFDNNDSNWQIGDDSIRYTGSKHKKKFDFGKKILFVPVFFIVNL